MESEQKNIEKNINEQLTFLMIFTSIFLNYIFFLIILDVEKNKDAVNAKVFMLTS